MKNVISTPTKIAHFFSNKENMKGGMCFDTAIVKDRKGNVYEISWGLNIKKDFIENHPKRKFAYIGKHIGHYFELVLRESICKKINYF